MKRTNPFTKIVAKCDTLLARIDAVETKTRRLLADGDAARAEWIARNPALAARIYR